MSAEIVDLRAFRELQRRLNLIAQGRTIPGVAERLAAVGVAQLMNSFRDSRDPYGKPWAPVFRRRRGTGAKAGRADKPLIDTGRMRGSVVGLVQGKSIRVVIPTEYASYHQKGTRYIPRRQMLPEASTGGLGPYWTLALNGEAARIINEQVTGKR